MAFNFNNLSSKYNIILAEDNPEHQKLIKKMLEKYNLNIDIANNGKELLSMLEHGPHYDLILMDIQMPIMDGYRATEEIRKKPRFSEIPIIGITAFAMEGDEQIAIAKGMNDYITKPIDKQILYKTLSKYLLLK
ncbi:MAG: response regulator [candidate division WOR-3 bacterium]